MNDCKHCGTALKSGMLTSNVELPDSRLTIINLAVEEPWPAACNKCGDQVYLGSRRVLEREAAQLRHDLKSLLLRLPILSLQQPQGWSYQPITIVTAQTVTGTGVFSDVASAFTDLFGAQSGTYNAKLREGENHCKAALRAQTIELGGNAVIGVDVDYAEVGGTRAMLMVCMTGTAIRIDKMDVKDDAFFSSMSSAHTMALCARLLQGALQAPDN